MNTHPPPPKSSGFTVHSGEMLSLVWTYCTNLSHVSYGQDFAQPFPVQASVVVNNNYNNKKIKQPRFQQELFIVHLNGSFIFFAPQSGIKVGDFYGQLLGTFNDHFSLLARHIVGDLGSKTSVRHQKNFKFLHERTTINTCIFFNKR